MWEHRPRDTGVETLPLELLHLWRYAPRHGSFAGLMLPDTREELDINWCNRASDYRPKSHARVRPVWYQAITIWVRTSTLSARLMAAKTAEMLLMVGFPDWDNIRCRLFAGL